MRYKNKSGQFFSILGGKKLPVFIMNTEIKHKHLQLHSKNNSDKHG